MDFTGQKLPSESDRFLIVQEGDFLKSRRHERLAAMIFNELSHLAASAAFKRNDAKALERPRFRRRLEHASFY
jgi:hypothetical protein